MIILIIIVIMIVAMDMAMTTATSFLFLFPIIIMCAVRIPRIHYVAISWWPDGPWHIQGICRWWWWGIQERRRVCKREGRKNGSRDSRISSRRNGSRESWNGRTERSNRSRRESRS